MKEVTLNSGSILKIGNVPFAEARALYQALLDDAKSVPFVSGTDLGEVIKNAFCTGFSSKKIESTLWVCLSRCTYNDLKIDLNTFEPISAREDYSKICLEVAQEVVAPFVKGLSVELSRLSAMILSSRK